MRTNPKRNRLLSIFLSVAMVLSMLPTGALRAYAEELAPDEPAVAAPAEVGEEAEAEVEAEPEEALATEAEAEPEEVLATEAEEQQAEPQLIEQTLTAKVGEGEDALEVKAEGMMPEGAELRVVEVPVEKVDAITEGETFLALDIAVVVAGEVWQPEEHGSELKVTVEKPEAIAEEARVEVMHVKADVTDEEGALDEQAVEALPEAVEAEEVETEAVETDGEAADGEVAFEAGSFSLYLFYTVEFSYDGYQYVLQGGGSVALSEVLAALGIAVDAADVASVEFSDPGLVSVEQADGDWTLTSLQAFDTEEKLTVTLANGDSYVIAVTDSQASGSSTLQVTGAIAGVISDADVDETNFELNPTQTISITAMVAMPQQAGEKTVTFHVPAGWAIVGYSRLESDEDTTQTSASGAFCGYTETVGAYVEIDGQYKDNIEKTTLSTLADEETRYGTLVTPEDGKWGTQYLEGYGTGRGSVYGGDVTYTFKPNAANAKLVVTLRPQARLFPHISSEYTEEMPPVTVTTSCTVGDNTETLTSEMNVVVTDIPKASLHTTNPNYNVVSYAPDTRSGMIVIGASDNFFFSSSGSWASQTNVDEWEYTITYPAGVFIARDSDGNLITKSTDPAATMRSWGEYEINEDETQGGGTITMRGTHGSLSHSSTGFSRFGFMFYAKTGEGDDFEPDCTTYHESDSQVVITGSGWIKRCGETLDLNNTWKSNIKVFDEGEDSLYITLYDSTDTRRDLTGDFGHEDYSWYLANMKYSTKYTYGDVRFRFVNNIAEDGSYLGVNGFTLPGRHLHDIVVTTTKGRTVTLYENGQYASTGYHQTNNYCREPGAYRVTREMLGLDIDEFILTAECTLDIKQGTYVENYLTSGIGVIGRNINGKGGTVTVSVIDDDGNVVINPETEKPIQATLTNVPGLKVIGAGNCTSVVTRSPYTTDVNEYTPSDYIQFSSSYHAGSVMLNISQDTIIDPTITIALPEGVKLNENSVEGRSPAGNHGDEWFTLEKVAYREVEDENGVVWQCYDYKSPEVLDLVAVESNTNAENTTQAETWMYVRFGATVGPTCPQYSLNTDEIILWYLGSGNISSATQGTNYIVMDGTKTGHTANGEPVSADNPAVPTKVVAPSNDFLIKDLVGLGVDLSIRSVEDPEEDWMTYNGGDSSAAIVHEGKNAEVKLNYFSTSKSEFFKETELFIEIPHEGVSLKYVNNANIENPIDEEVIKTPEFTMALTGPVTMVDDDDDDYVTTWKTYYATAATSNSKTYEEAVEEGTEAADAWTPFTDVEWKTADQLTEADYKDVVLVKFVADNDIAPEGTGSVIMNLEVADDAELDQFDYWRAYARERLGDHARDWRYTPVIAATPSSATLSGLLFVDEDDDADFDEDVEQAFTDGTVTATIKGGNNYLGGEALTINSDGTFDLVDDEGRTIYLRKGDYTITFTMDAEDSENFFERIDSATPSTVDTDEARTVDWYNDIKTANVSGMTATYKFTVDKSMVPKNSAGDYVPAIYPVGVGLNNVTVTAEKVWEDEDNQDGIRPASVTIELLANGEPAGMSVTLNGEVDDYGETEPWVATFDGLDAIKDGELVAYTVTETVEGVITGTDGPGTYKFEVEAVEGEENSFTVTNTHTPELRDITATKVWSDNNNQDGCRPDSVTLKLMNGTTEVGSVTLDGTADENGETAAWTATWEDVAKYEGGTEISYTVTEVTTGTITGADGPKTYKFEVTGSMADGFKVTNTHTPETVVVRGVKIWDDAKYFKNGTAIADYARPESVKITLKADDTATEKTVTVDGTPDEAGEYEAWKYEFTRLDKYKAGTVITYSIVEDVPTGYAATYVNNYDVKNTPNEGEELNPTQLVVKKVDSETTTGAGLKGAEFELTKPDGSTATYTTNDNGTVTIPLTVDGDYTLEETKAPEGYQLDTANKFEIDVDREFVEITFKKSIWTWIYDLIVGISNEPDFENGTLTVADPPTTKGVEATKVWDDDGDRDGLREDVTFDLYKTVGTAEPAKVDGQSKAVTYDASGEPVKLTWTDLPAYEDGVAVTYSVDEAEVPDGYEKTVEGDEASGFTITNKHVPATLDVSVTKVWEDEDNQDGCRPGSVEVTLSGTDSANAAAALPAETVATQTLDESNGWAYTWEKLYKYQDHGKEITYSVAETETDVITGTDAAGTYAYEVTGSAAEGFTVTNTHTPEVRDIEVEKAWDDADDQDGFRPASVTVNLMDGETVVDSAEIVVGEDGSWKHAFTGLTKYRPGKQGEEIAYTVEEAETDVITGTDGPGTYAHEVTGDMAEGFTVTNKHTPELRDVTAEKVWDDAENQDGKRPLSVTFKLFADGEEAGLAVADAGNEWKVTFAGLDKYKSGVEIVYTVDEEPVKDYAATIEGDMADGFSITNSYSPETLNINGVKTWDDADDQDGLRPESVTVTLTGVADGETVVTETTTATAETDWAYSFVDQPRYKAEGIEIEYSVAEDAVNGYETEVSGYNVKNTHEPELTEVSVTKTWDDGDDVNGLRPESVTVKLLADGEAVQEATLTEADGWAHTFAGLPKYRDHGTEIVYTVEEEAVAGYEATITGSAAEGFAITNAHEVDVITVDPPVKKTVKGEGAPADAEFTFTFTANPGASTLPEGMTEMPMPDGSSGQTKSITKNSPGEYEFGRFEISQPGTYVYTMTEEAGSGEGWTYDGATYTVTYVVEAVGGHLTETTNITRNGAAYSSAVPEFVNSYEKPTKPVPPVVPHTGDDTPAGLIAGLAAAGLAAVGAGVVARRRRRREE